MGLSIILFSLVLFHKFHRSCSLFFPILKLTPFTVAEVNELLIRSANFSFNHEYSGALSGGSRSATAPSDSFKLLSASVEIGKGMECFLRATDLIMNFKLTDSLKWAKVCYLPEGGIHIGSGVTTMVKCFNLLWVLSPCRVTSHVSKARFGSASPESLFSQVAFSTLVGHLIAGEERFRVDFDGKTEVVSFSMLSYSKGYSILGALAMPLIRPIQKSFFSDHCNAIQKLARGRN